MEKEKNKATEERIRHDAELLHGGASVEKVKTEEGGKDFFNPTQKQIDAMAIEGASARDDYERLTSPEFAISLNRLKEKAKEVSGFFELAYRQLERRYDALSRIGSHVAEGKSASENDLIEVRETDVWLRAHGIEISSSIAFLDEAARFTEEFKFDAQLNRLGFHLRGGLSGITDFKNSERVIAAIETVRGAVLHQAGEFKK